MSDPDRLLRRAGGIDAQLLAAALDEKPPPDLLARTLATMGAASGAAAVPVAASKLFALKGMGAGILGALGAGVLTGVVGVAAFDLATSLRREPVRGDAPAAVTEPRGAPEHRSEARRAVTPPRPISGEKTEDTPAIAPAPPSPTPASPPASPRPPALAAEIALLDEARRALDGGEPARAKALMDRYAREMPRGQLTREAGVLRARAAQAMRGLPANEKANP